MSDEGPDGQLCTSCGAAYEPLQEYCLECGERLPRGPGRLSRYPAWAVTGVLLLVVAGIATAVSAAASSNATTTIVATQTSLSVQTTKPHITVTVNTTPKPPPTTTGKLPTAPGTTTAVRPAAPGLSPWPATATGFTDVLESVPLSSGRAAAIALARKAKAAGLPQAGVLVSAAYPSLHPGYYVVFSGIYPASAGAVAGLRAAHAKGFPGAYVARVTHP
jgi:hypothetical protein